MTDTTNTIDAELKRIYKKSKEESLKLKECLNTYYSSEDVFHIRQAVIYRQSLEDSIVKMERLIRKLKTGRHLLQELTLPEYYKIMNDLSSEIAPSLRHSMHIIESIYRKLTLSTTQSTGIN